MYQEALDYFMKAIRVASLFGLKMTDPNLLYHLAGDCYSRLGQYEDCKVMFLLAGEEFTSSFSLYRLGCADFYLGSLQEAEQELSLANSLDSSCAETWGYLTLVLLSKEQPEFNAAYQTMCESFNLGLSDINILE